MKKVLFLGIALTAYANTSFSASEVAGDVVVPPSTGTVRGPGFDPNNFLDIVGEIDTRVPGPIQVRRGYSHEHGPEGISGTPVTPAQTPLAPTPEVVAPIGG